MNTRGHVANGLTGWHVLIALAAFFGLYFAVATFGGGDTSNAYRKGLDYNATLAAAERQAERGWHSEIHYNAKEGKLFASVFGRDAQPVTGLRVAAILSRPATHREDRAIVLTELAQGVYGAEIKLAPGLWVLSLASGEEEGALYRLKRRLLVPDRL